MNNNSKRKQKHPSLVSGSIDTHSKQPDGSEHGKDQVKQSYAEQGLVTPESAKQKPLAISLPPTTRRGKEIFDSDWGKAEVFSKRKSLLTLDPTAKSVVILGLL